MATSNTKLLKNEGRFSLPPVGLLIVLSALVVRFALSTLPGYDVRDYRVWAGLVAHGGATAIYHADIFIPYNYPPILAYILEPICRFYSLFSPSFDTGSMLLGVLLRAPAILADAGIALAIYLFLRKRVTPRSALLGSLAYGLNPAIIWNTGYWGGIDSIHALLAFMAVILLVGRLPEVAWLLLTVSVLMKPLSLPVVIVAAFLTVVRFGLLRAALSATVAAATAFVVAVPFLLAVTFGEMWTALTGNLGNYNNISAQAHNFWWMVSGGQGWTKDTNLLLGIASYRAIGFALFALFALWCLSMLHKNSPESHVFAIGALISFAFYMFPTEVHENWVFGVFPFLVVASVLEPRFRPVLIGLTVTFWLNMALHELYFGYDLPKGWLGSLLTVARLGNAIANSVIMCYAALAMLRSYRATAMARKLVLVLRRKLDASG